jgi:hypothetical protein
MARIAPSRRSLYGIMANHGFGGLTIHTKQGVTIEIPPEQITRKGEIKKHILAHTKELTRENAEYLETKGVKIYVGKGCH